MLRIANMKDASKLVAEYDRAMRARIAEQRLGVGGPPMRMPKAGQQYPRYQQGMGVGDAVPFTSVQQGGNCQPVTPTQCGPCVRSENDCGYHPAIFCGWTALPFSTFRDQGDTQGVDAGPVTAAWGATREIRVTAERACYFRIRGLWMRSVNSEDLSTELSFLLNITINRVPQVLEIGTIAPNERIGIPTAMFDGPFWVLPTDWGILTAINNNSRPLNLSFATPAATDQHVFGVLFGDALNEAQIACNPVDKNRIYGDNPMGVWMN